MIIRIDSNSAFIIFADIFKIENVLAETSKTLYNVFTLLKRVNSVKTLSAHKNAGLLNLTSELGYISCRHSINKIEIKYYFIFLSKHYQEL